MEEEERSGRVELFWRVERYKICSIIYWSEWSIWEVIPFRKGLKIQMDRDFPGGPVVKNLPCNAGDAGSIPGWGTKIPQAGQHGQKKR